MATIKGGVSYNTSANQTRNTTYNYSPDQAPEGVADGNSSYNYSEIYDAGDTESSAGESKNQSRGSSADTVWGVTMGQTQNFSFRIDDLCAADTAFNLPKRDGLFLPLKSLEFKPVSLEHLKLKAGIFADLPFFHRRKLGVLNCVMHDSHRSLIVQELFKWYNSCVLTSSGRVQYIDKMCKDASYVEYTFDGKVAVKYKFVVMPDNDISTNRVHEGDGALFEYRFSLIIVSDIDVYSNGKWVEADWGEGWGPDADYERRVHGIVYNYDGQGHNAYIQDPSIAEALYGEQQY